MKADKIMAVDGAARGRHAAVGADGDGRCLSLGGALPGGKRGMRRGGQDTLRGGRLDEQSTRGMESCRAS